MRTQSDGNQAEIVKALRDAGCIVWGIVGANGRRGCPDLLVGRAGKTYLLEVKRPLGPKGGKRGSELSPEQEAFRRMWLGGPLATVRTKIEALEAVGLAIPPPF